VFIALGISDDADLSLPLSTEVFSYLINSGLSRAGSLAGLEGFTSGTFATGSADLGSGFIAYSMGDLLSTLGYGVAAFDYLL